MADQDEATQGTIPPKVTPFSKPEGASPITPAAPGAPRPITVRLRPVAPAPAAETAAETPAVPTAAPAVGIPTPAPLNPRATSRVPVPEAVAAAAATAPLRTATVRLRPVAPMAATPAPAHVAGATQPIAKMEPVAAPAISPISPMQPQHPPVPGSNPLPQGPKPPSGAQVQAAKSKTSRISLDSAIGVAPVGSEKEAPKTIRLKRPSDLAAPAPTVPKGPSAAVRQTSRIPDSALPTAEPGAAESASVTQKKTLKIKRPTGAKEEAPAAAAGGEAAFPEGVQMTPLSPLGLPAKEESSIFTTIATVAAAASIVLLLALAWCLAAHAISPSAGKNALASVSLGSLELPWGGRLN